MGDWFLDNTGSWVYDKDAPTPRLDPDLTQIQPSVPSAYPDGFERPDGTYGRVDPAQLALFDDVDSTTIFDPGAPD